jgi:hypothetical protein
MLTIPTIHTTRELQAAIALTGKEAESTGFSGLVGVEILFEDGQPQSFRYSAESRSDRKKVQQARTGKPA